MRWEVRFTREGGAPHDGPHLLGGVPPCLGDGTVVWVDSSCRRGVRYGQERLTNLGCVRISSTLLRPNRTTYPDCHVRALRRRLTLPNSGGPALNV